MVFDSQYRRQALASLEKDRETFLKKSIQFVSRKRDLAENTLSYGVATTLLKILQKNLDL